MIENILWVFGMVGIYRMLIYAIGDPHDEYNPKSILSKYSAFIAFLRLKQLDPKVDDLFEKGETKEDRIINGEMVKSYLVNKAKPVAGWTNAVGLCSTCTSFWFMLLAVAIPTQSIELYGISLLISRAAFKYL